MTDASSLDAGQLAAYLALKEVGSLIEHAVEQQLRADGGLSGPQFQILASLADAPRGRLRMTDLADGLVYSRSGLTYQAAQLEKAGLVTRAPAEEDERSIIVTLTPRGRELLGKVMPGHVEVVQRLLIDVLDPADLATMAGILNRVRDRMRTGPPRSAAPRRSAGARKPR
ncbi:MarR family transcriptional regulator [Actinoplanes sp. NBRC 14428]|uniref:MarR family transcriptional regulator n=1 Tax=Pseudosporangium ferrugineum TaxID=439699 RepID=A0A2T0S867_9ACTN|nr:MarR family transcriptional regulator [Pseudosporangium ferrugineum]PRY29585.1 MarR family transcriptional regulator [Pseudosporangium ferrugineum]BCJ52658.1 MarR family transcriptional regulator [Actinoplanes sp. NBRC 14428]